MTLDNIITLHNIIHDRIFKFLLSDLKWYERAYWKIRGYNAYNGHVKRI